MTAEGEPRQIRRARFFFGADFWVVSPARPVPPYLPVRPACCRGRFVRLFVRLRLSLALSGVAVLVCPLRGFSASCVRRVAFGFSASFSWVFLSCAVGGVPVRLFVWLRCAFGSVGWGSGSARFAALASGVVPSVGWRLASAGSLALALFPFSAFGGPPSLGTRSVGPPMQLPRQGRLQNTEFCIIRGPCPKLHAPAGVQNAYFV